MVYSIKRDLTPNTQNLTPTIICSHANHRGDVIARSDETGSLTSFALYEAYGTRPYEWPVGGTGDPDRQKANTKEEETDLNLLNEGMRYRDLETGTFLSRDPIRYGDGPNMYCYVHCNPIMNFDPFGLALKKFNAPVSQVPVRPVTRDELRRAGANISNQNGMFDHGWNDHIAGFKSEKNQQKNENHSGTKFETFRQWGLQLEARKSDDVFGQMNPTIGIFEGLKEGSVEYDRAYSHEKDHAQNAIDKWNALAEELNGAPKPSNPSQSAAFNKYAKYAHEYYKYQKYTEDARIDKQYTEDRVKEKGEKRLRKEDLEKKMDKQDADIKKDEAREAAAKEKYEEAKKEYEKSLENDD